jgi:hypothetical protein
MPNIRRGMPDVSLTKDEFKRRFRQRFYDPAFAPLQEEIERLADVAWDGYDGYRKAPRTERAGPGFADPDYELSIEWRAASQEVQDAEQRQKNPSSPPRILLINGATRSEHTCPGENIEDLAPRHDRVRDVRARKGFRDGSPGPQPVGIGIRSHDPSLQDLRLDRDAALPLAVFLLPEPRHGTGRRLDERHLSDVGGRTWHHDHLPGHWYQAPSSLKLMIDRLVCADGGNSDPTSTQGKDAERAKKLELDGWHYPRHLSGRVFSVVVHGDAAGVDGLRNGLANWLADMGLIDAGNMSQLGAYIGYMRPYATSHDDLDKDTAFQEEVRNAARSLTAAVKQLRRGELKPPDAGLRAPRQK